MFPQRALQATVRSRQGHLFAVLLLFVIPAASSAQAQTAAARRESTHGTKTARAVRVESPIVLDGNLEEPAWQRASLASGFIQRDPQEGQPSTEKTEFRVLYTATTLYIGVQCYDSNPQGILANDRRRDSEMGNDDTISIVLDTFHDHRNTYVFRTNPLGDQYDALVTDEGRNVNSNWDERWDASARIHEAGWSVEFAIPFKSVRTVEENENLVWGLDLERVIRRKNESASWNNYRRGFQLDNVSQAGHLRGLQEIQTGLRLRIKPYLLAGRSASVRRDTQAPGRFTSNWRNASDVGIEVMKYRITPSLTADVTWNTDFAQTEVDSQQINLDRFPLFFPERREFFQEGAGVFEFGIAAGENRGSAEMKLFHSRQIGLSPRRVPVPIIGGGRVTGRLQGLTLGLLNVQTEAFAPEQIRASNYSVVRVKRDVFSRSSIGGFLLNREQGGTSDYNRVYGADANFVFYRYLSLGGFLGKSDSPNAALVSRDNPTGRSRGNWVSAGGIRWESDALEVGTSWVVVDPDFRDDLGFVPRKDMRTISSQVGWRPRIDGRHIRQLIFRLRNDYTMNQKHRLETRINHSAFEINFQDGSVLTWSPHTRLDTFYEPFRIRPGVVEIPAGTYSWWNNSLRYSPNPSKRISGQIFNWAWHIGYYGMGTLHDINFNPRLRLTNQLSMQIGYGINKATFPASMCVNKSAGGCGFTDHLVNTRISYNFNNQWLTTATIQYNNADSFFGFNFRLNYIFRPGDDFFLIYNEGRQVGGRLDGEKDRTIQAKLTYSFDF